MLMRRLERDFPREQRRDGRLPRRRIQEIAMTAPDDVGGLSYYGRAPIWKTVVFDGSTPADDLRPRIARVP